MFGYILPEKPELKIKEYELFRAFYCGVCKSIGKRYGQLPRFTLNYDSTFLAILLSSIAQTKESLSIKHERCIAHPIKKRFAVKDNEIIDYASDMNIVLAYYNLEDNWKDDRSVLSAVGTLAFRSAFKKLNTKYPEKCSIIKQKLQELSKLETQECSSVDKAAEPFGRLMEEIIAYDRLCGNEKNAKILRWLGYNLGRWIYILDAYDDIEKDIKKSNYNPFVLQYNYNNEDIQCFKEKVRERAEFNLTYSLSQIGNAYELLEVKDNSSLVENIIYMGMLRKTEQILGMGSCSKIEKSI